MLRTRQPYILFSMRLAPHLSRLVSGALACTGRGNDEEETSFDIESAVATSAANAEAIAFTPDGRFAARRTRCIRVVTPGVYFCTTPV